MLEPRASPPRCGSGSPCAIHSHAGSPLYHGLAVGLLVLAGLGFTIDHYAEARAVDYLRGLERAGALEAR